MTTAHVRYNKTSSEDMFVYKRLVLLLGALILLMVGLYAYAIGSTIHLVIARSSAQKQSETLQSSIAKLQVSYLSNSESVTLDRGTALGLHETKHVSFVKKATPASEVAFAGGNEL
jgi:cell division protein FtsL